MPKYLSTKLSNYLNVYEVKCINIPIPKQLAMNERMEGKSLT